MAACISQIRVKQNDGSYSDVPCGRCGICLQNRRKEWSFRLQKELRYHETARFITLTYSDENLVWGTSDSGHTYPLLCKRDLQLFMKRLRKRQEKYTEKRIKYYAVGEYGSETNRPHYHAIIFGIHPEVQKEILDIWMLGHIHLGDVNANTIDYVTKYVINRLENKHYLEPPFSSISNGIGLGHLEKNKKVYKSDSVVRNDRGYKQKLPRYYRDKLDENRWINKIKSTQAVQSFEEKRKAEIERLSKTHKEPERYYEEREIHASERIIKRAKQGSKI